jgi:hypothetical protein
MFHFSQFSRMLHLQESTVALQRVQAKLCEEVPRVEVIEKLERTYHEQSLGWLKFEFLTCLFSYI